MKILMVCLGNICRSPLAEGILKQQIKKAGLDWTIESAGTNDFHVGESPHPSSCKVASLKGIDISNQIARQFRSNDFITYDRIYAMANDVIRDMKKIAGKQFDETKVTLLLEETNPGENLDVPDPWYGGEEGYFPVFSLIENACSKIVQNHLKELQHD